MKYFPNSSSEKVLMNELRKSKGQSYKVAKSYKLGKVAQSDWRLCSPVPIVGGAEGDTDLLREERGFLTS